MEIIQASGSCSPRPRPYLHPFLRHHFSSSSTKHHFYSPFFPNTALSLKHKTPISTTTCSVLENGTSDLVATKVAEDDRLLAIKKKASEISPDLKGTSIFLVGLNSSYKSSLGRILADALRYYYFDSDSLVEEAAGGKSAAISYIERDEVGYLASETEVLKQLSSMGRLVVGAGNGAVKSSTNLYECNARLLFILINTRHHVLHVITNRVLVVFRSLLRHGISIWIDVPLDLVAREIMEDRIQLSASDTPTCRSSSEVLTQLTTLYDSGRSGYSTADAIISLQKVASQLGYDELNAVSTEDLCMEAMKEIEKLMRVKKMMEEAARPF